MADLEFSTLGSPWQRAPAVLGSSSSVKTPARWVQGSHAVAYSTPQGVAQCQGTLWSQVHGQVLGSPSQLDTSTEPPAEGPGYPSSIAWEPVRPVGAQAPAQTLLTEELSLVTIPSDVVARGHPVTSRCLICI